MIAVTCSLDQQNLVVNQRCKRSCFAIGESQFNTKKQLDSVFEHFCEESNHPRTKQKQVLTHHSIITVCTVETGRQFKPHPNPKVCHIKMVKNEKIDTLGKVKTQCWFLISG